MGTIFELIIRNYFVFYMGGISKFLFLKYILRRKITLDESLYGKKNLDGSIDKGEEIRVGFNNRVLGLIVSIPVIIAIVYIVF